MTAVRPLFIAVPAWGRDYVELAVRYTVPAALAALRAFSPAARATWLIHTDEPASFAALLAGHEVEFRAPARAAGRDAQWVAFKAAHKDALAFTPLGGLLTLLNSDIVISRETFAAVIPALQGAKKVGVSVGIRTLIDGNTPPVGADAETLSQYIWSHRHPITDENIWGCGRTRHPTILFFPHAGGAVSMHCFHQTPMWIVKDRELRFSGTIDDDLLEGYQDNELVFFGERQFAIAELSPGNKTHPFADPLSVASVLDFGRRRFRPSHIRNFKQRFAVLGCPSEDHPAVAEIVAGLQAAAPAPRAAVGLRNLVDARGRCVVLR